MHPPACIWEACWTCLADAGLAGHLLDICWYHGAPLAMASVAVLLPAIVTIAVTVKRCLASISIAVYCALGAWVSMTLVYTGKIVAIIVYADAIFTIGVVVQEKLFTTFVYAEATILPLAILETVRPCSSGWLLGASLGLGLRSASLVSFG